MLFVFPFYLQVTTVYLVVTSVYIAVTSGYLIAETGYFWLLLVTSGPKSRNKMLQKLLQKSLYDVKF